ncbi:type IV pili methyl-accepting chemotaxis transducer N-terminal domain-containing protein [Hydrogenophaga flava]|uniref:type IV pili methyl-accepting chemotaxis transducer N-terminal domain-containing protein n=1 Tax=Hydrogenophaga flava TaxID=65657 RepID=UPI0008249A06|nr:type IV pili methyl-accepting chemotaxis transducer N-terminal domain-containing protein [Hydrogenophaga flava]
MTSVLLLRQGPRGLLPLQADLEAAGMAVLAVVEDCSKLVQAAVQHAPDLVVGEAPRPDETLFKATHTLAEVLPKPVLLFTPDADAAHIERATAAGVHAWVVNGYGAERLRPLVHLAQARFGREQALLEQLRDVSQRFEERKQVERAKGILMRARALSDDDAFQILRTASMHTNQRLGQVSEQIIQSAHFAEAVNRAGQLRMLSQRLVKLHLLRLADVQSRQQQALLDDSVQRVDANLAWLGKGLSQPSFGDLLGLLGSTWQALKASFRGKPVAGQVQQVDDLADRLLQDAERLTASLQHAGAVASLQVLNVAGRQRMLSQRFAKMTLMDLLGIEDSATGRSAAMTDVQGDFERALAYLNGLPLSTPDIRTALDEAALGWQQMLAATPQDRRPAGRDRLARMETVAHASEALLDRFEQLSTHYERSMQMLMG